MSTNQPPHQTTAAEQPVTRSKEEVVKEAKRIEEACLFSSKGHYNAAMLWSYCHIVLGLPAAILAGIAAAEAFKNNAQWAGYFSIIVAGLTSAATFLNPKEKENLHRQAGNKLDALLNRVRIFWSIEVWREDSAEVVTARLKEFSEEKIGINANSPQIPLPAYWLAKHGIKKGEGRYEVDTPA